MANKRDLKRTINYITSELFAECVAASLYNCIMANQSKKTWTASFLSLL